MPKHLAGQAVPAAARRLPGDAGHPERAASEATNSMVHFSEKAAGRGETAAYIEHVSAELRDLAVRHDLRFLAYLIDMACQEAALEMARGPRRTAGTAAK